MYSYSKAVIVWIDDHFLTNTFKEDKEKNAWHKLFGKINSNLYRLLNIEVKYIKTAQEAQMYIKSVNRFKSNTYYYFIIDRKLPYSIDGDAVDSNSEDVIKYLQNYKQKYNCLDFSVLSSGSPDSYSIKNIDYHIKPQNKEFTLPDELRHKILLNIKENIIFIDQYDFVSNLKINQFGTKLFNYEKQSSLLYPFLEKYKSFVELEEIDKRNFSTLIILTPKSVSNKFVLQNILISLFDSLKDYNGINFYTEDSYNKLKLSGNFEAINELTDQIPVIRLGKLDIESYRNLNSHLKYKQIKVFAIDSHDDNISNYIDNTPNVKIIKIDTISNSPDISKSILFALLKQYLNNLNFDIEDTIYSNNNILFIHPLMYTMVLSSEIKIDDFDDPSEIIDEINNYFNTLGLIGLGDADETKKNILKSFPLEQSEDVYTQIKRLCGDDCTYNKVLFEALKYWLNNAWNINYNINVDNCKLEIQHKWQKYSFDLLCALLTRVDLEKIVDKDIENIKEIKKTSLYFINNIKSNKFSPSKVLWPHEKFPMPSYIQNKLFEFSNQKLYVQDKDLNFIDDSVEIANSFKSLEFKIEYYRSVFNLIQDSSIYMPKEISKFIINISNRIQNNEDIFIDKNNNIIANDRDNFKKLANILLRVAINFGKLVLDIDENKINYHCNITQPFSEDKAGLGMLVSDLRDHIYNKMDIFSLDNNEIKCTSYLNQNHHKDFILTGTKLFNALEKTLTDTDTIKNKFNIDENLKKYSIEVIITENIEFTLNNKTIKYTKGQEVDEIEINKINSDIVKFNKNNEGTKNKKLLKIQYVYKDLDVAYMKKLFVSNNITKISQISTLSSYLMQQEHYFKIQKHMGAYSFFAYLADTRNTWEHGDDKAWSKELFIESFIYGYESIWLMQKYILENIYKQKKLPSSAYVHLNTDLNISKERKEKFMKTFNKLDSYKEYYTKLVNK